MSIRMPGATTRQADQRSTAKVLRQSKQYERAASIYAQLWHENQEAADPWDGWGLASCLRHLRRFPEAEAVCRRIMEALPDFEQARNELAWCLYDAHINVPREQIKQNEKGFASHVREVLGLAPQGQYTPYVRSVFKVLDYLKDKPRPQSGNVIRWLEKLNPDILSQDVYKFTDSARKSMELASDMEKWYTYRAKALLELKRYEECREACHIGLDRVTNFHYDNDIWLRWRTALCDANTGRIDEAVAALQNLLKRKRAWFIEHELAKLFYHKGKYDEAESYAVSACADPQDDIYKWELYKLMAEIALAQVDNPNAQLHVMLAVQARTEAGLELPSALKELVSVLDIRLPVERTSSDLKHELEPHWKKAAERSRPRLSGTIKTVLSHGRAGFISAEDGIDYYFKTGSFGGRRGDMYIGLNVSFQWVERIDPKDGKEKREAINVLARS